MAADHDPTARDDSMTTPDSAPRRGARWILVALGVVVALILLVVVFSIFAAPDYR